MNYRGIEALYNVRIPEVITFAISHLKDQIGHHLCYSVCLPHRLPDKITKMSEPPPCPTKQLNGLPCSTSRNVWKTPAWVCVCFWGRERCSGDGGGVRMTQRKVVLKKIKDKETCFPTLLYLPQQEGKNPGKLRLTFNSLF